MNHHDEEETLAGFSNLSPMETHRAREVLLQLASASHSSAEAQNVNEVLEQIIGAQACQSIGALKLADDFLLSVVVPVFNEAATIELVVKRVMDTGLPVEMIVVDDGSTDGTRERLEHLTATNVVLIRHERNLGKGAALKSGFAKASGDIVVIQDGDLEYDPRDYLLMLPYILNDKADVVYGSRFQEVTCPASPWWHRCGNRAITKLACAATKLSLTDVESCYKMMRRSVLEQVRPSLREQRFGIEIELTAKLAKLPGVRFQEAAISYHKRTVAEGKKIGLGDGLRALWCIVKYS